jgi:LPXTG-motif cell wall-anchored protein
MKRFTAILLTLILTVGMSCVAVSADGDVNVYVSIADAAGKLVVAHEAVKVSDADGDGSLTINDALIAAHDKFYDGGAEAGYGSYVGDYGLSMSKLWGEENGGSYGYYVNNASAWSLADPVAAGDHVYAFVYTDLVGWSDAYSWFDASAKDASAGDPVTVALSSLGYDADWNQVISPVAGASVTVNGEASGVVTDAEGKAAIAFDKAGTYVISATSDSMTLVPPVCIVTIAAAGLPKTGVAETSTFVFAGLAVLAMGAVLVTVSRKKTNEI